ncbi:MAG TPA: hypothetical protein VF999_06390 [Thermoanaerobaculia bacterium]
MSQKNVEILLGKILTDDGFRESFLPVRPRSFELASSLGLEFSAVERSALSTLRRRAFECLARTLDPRISRSSASVERLAAGGEGGT